MKHLVYVHLRIFWDTVFPRHESSRSSVILLVVLGHSPTVPETEKTTVIVKSACIPETALVLFALNSFLKKLHIVIRLLQVAWVDNKNAGIFIPILQGLSNFAWKALWKDVSLRECVGSQGRRTSQTHLCNSIACFENGARSWLCVLKLMILRSALTRFYFLSRHARSSDCCLNRYKSRARSFWRSCVIQWGSLLVAPE